MVISTVKRNHTYSPDTRDYESIQQATEQLWLTELDKIMPPWMDFMDVMHILAAHLKGVGTDNIDGITIHYFD